MNFASLVDGIRTYVNSGAPLRSMLQFLQQGKGFAHLRFNDGESLCAFRLRPETERNNCGAYYYTDLGAALKRVLICARDLRQRDPNSRLMIGGYWYNQGSKISNLDEAAQALVGFCGASDDNIGWLDKPWWVGSDDLVEGLVTDLPYQIFDHIRNSGRPVYVIGNPRNEPGRHCMGAKYIPISRTDAWREGRRVMQTVDILAQAESPAIFLWACGMCKPWILDTWLKRPHTSHLDIGHLFDACFGEYSRAYTRRRNREEPKWRAYEDRFIPWCRSFIPAGGFVPQ